jgi:hypothetical protein
VLACPARELAAQALMTSVTSAQIKDSELGMKTCKLFALDKPSASGSNSSCQQKFGHTPKK